MKLLAQAQMLPLMAGPLSTGVASASAGSLPHAIHPFINERDAFNPSNFRPSTNINFASSAPPPGISRFASTAPRAEGELRFADARVEAFYQTALKDGIDYEVLRLLLVDLFDYDKKRLAKVEVLLKGHAHLSENFARDIAEAMQRYSDGEPLRYDRNADLILRYDEAIAQGAAQESFDEMVRWLGDASHRIDAIRPYAIQGEISVAKSVSRALDDRSMARLRGHKLIELLNELSEQTAFDVGGLLADLIEDDALPAKARSDLLTAMRLSYDEESAAFRREGRVVELGEDDGAQILPSLITFLGHPSMTDTRAQSVVVELLVALLIKELGSNPHFRENWKKISDALDADTLDQQQCESIYQACVEILQHGIPDYALPEFFPEIQQLVLSFFLKEQEVLTKVSAWEGGPVAADELPALAGAYNAQAQVLRADGKKREANEAFARYRFLTEVNLKARREIEAIDTWPALYRALPKILSKTKSRRARSGLSAALKDITASFQQLRLQVQSFGKYFEEQLLEGEKEYLVLVPVKGLAAAVAIDTGSDCGKGEASTRVTHESSTIFLMTNPKRSRPLGYAGLYEVTSEQGLVMQIDALNPSTQLNLDGRDYLTKVRGHFARVEEKSAETGNPIRGFLLANNDELVSNRDSISRHAAAFRGSDATSFFERFRASDLRKEDVALKLYAAQLTDILMSCDGDTQKCQEAGARLEEIVQKIWEVKRVHGDRVKALDNVLDLFKSVLSFRVDPLPPFYKQVSSLEELANEVNALAAASDARFHVAGQEIGPSDWQAMFYALGLKEKLRVLRNEIIDRELLEEFRWSRPKAFKQVIACVRTAMEVVEELHDGVGLFVNRYGRSWLSDKLIHLGEEITAEYDGQMGQTDPRKSSLFILPEDAR